MASRPITQRAIREMRRTIKRLEAENRELRSDNGSLRRSFFAEYGARGAKWIVATAGETDTTMAAVRTAKLLGFGVAVRASDNGNRLDYYAIPTEVPRNV